MNDVLCLQVSSRDVYNILSFLQHDTHSRFERLENIIFMRNQQEGENEKNTVLYVLSSLEKKVSLHIKTDVQREVRSVTDIYKSAGWLERAVWEESGVLFLDHRDMRHLFRNYQY